MALIADLLACSKTFKGMCTLGVAISVGLSTLKGVASKPSSGGAPKVLSEAVFSGACRILRICRFWHFLSSLRASIASWRWKIAFEDPFADGRFFAETSYGLLDGLRAGWFWVVWETNVQLQLILQSCYLVSPVVLFA